jgi:hypothetical protein
VKWDLWELPVRMARQESTDVMRILQHIQADHIREPGVAQAVTNFLMQIGLVGPDGQPRMPMEARPSPAAEGSKLWTPDSESGAPKGGSKLWTPGS